jgi:hypothetical protein
MILGCCINNGLISLNDHCIFPAFIKKCPEMDSRIIPGNRWNG